MARQIRSLVSKLIYNNRLLDGENITARCPVIPHQVLEHLCWQNSSVVVYDLPSSEEKVRTILRRI